MLGYERGLLKITKKDKVVVYHHYQRKRVRSLGKVKGLPLFLIGMIEHGFKLWDDRAGVELCQIGQE